LSFFCYTAAAATTTTVIIIITEMHYLLLVLSAVWWQNLQHKTAHNSFTALLYYVSVYGHLISQYSSYITGRKLLHVHYSWALM